MEHYYASSHFLVNNHNPRRFPILSALKGSARVIVHDAHELYFGV